MQFGTGHRFKLQHTRRLIDAIHDGSLAKAEFETFEVFNLQIPKSVDGVPSELLHPAKAWSNASAFKDEVVKLAKRFTDNFEKYSPDVTDEVRAAGPKA